MIILKQTLIIRHYTNIICEQHKTRSFAQEAQAAEVYRSALTHVATKDYDTARKMFEDLLACPALEAANVCMK